MEKTLLIVEDDLQSQGMLKGIFGELNCHVLFAKPQVLDVKRAMAADPDLIVLGLASSAGESLMLLSTIDLMVRPRKNERYKMMVLASVADRELVVRAKELRIDDFMLKPIDLKSFVQRAKRHLGLLAA